MSQAITDMRTEINQIDRDISDLQDENGNCPVWMNERMNILVEQREAFYKSIFWMESRQKAGV